MNVIDLAMEFGVALVKAAGTNGGEYHGPCPGCGGRDRFHVWPDQNDGTGSYWCRQCGRHGDNIQFRRDFMGEDWRTAAAACGRDPGDPSLMGPRQPFRRPPKPPVPAFEPVANDAPAEAWREKATKLVDRANAVLLSDAGEPHRRWLAARGIGLAGIERYRLGWNPGDKGKDLFRPRESWGLPREMKDNGRAKKLWIPRGLVIPLVVDGEAWRVRIRRPEAHRSERSPKPYYLLPGPSMRQLVCDGDRRAALVVETELDGVMLSGVCGDLVTAIPLGSSSAKPDAGAHAVLEKALCILVALDFDKAGADALKWWAEHYPRAVRWPVPHGKDPGEAWAAGVDLRAWVVAGLPPALTIGRWEPGLNRKKGEGCDEQACGGAEDGAAAGVGKGETGTATEVEDDHHRQRVPDAGALFGDGVRGEARGRSVGEDYSVQGGGVERLAEILKRHPLRIENTERRLRILCPLGWHDDAVLKRLSDLVFFDADVGAYLAGHPARMLTGGNVL